MEPEYLVFISPFQVNCYIAKAYYMAKEPHIVIGKLVIGYFQYQSVPLTTTKTFCKLVMCLFTVSECTTIYFKYTCVKLIFFNTASIIYWNVDGAFFISIGTLWN